MKNFSALLPQLGIDDIVVDSGVISFEVLHASSSININVPRHRAGVKLIISASKNPRQLRQRTANNLQKHLTG
jgi:hypothetical protein